MQMKRVTSRDGTTISYERYGEGPPLVLVHGSFSDHETNWTYVKPLLAERFTVYAIARRGRGETAATTGHSVADEVADVAAVVQAVGEPVYLLGHSHGAHCALDAAAQAPERVAKLVLYEPPWPEQIVGGGVLERLEAFARPADWSALVETFLTDGLRVPAEDVAALRASPDWAPWIDDAPATLGDLRALARKTVTPERYRALAMPTLLLTGSESLNELYLTDALAANLPDARVVTLEGQAHEGMTTAPALFADVVTRFLVGEVAERRPQGAPVRAV
jgi:pimeloyl-ACP methyl ester carboxylesterase